MSGLLCIRLYSHDLLLSPTIYNQVLSTTGTTRATSYAGRAYGDFPIKSGPISGLVVVVVVVVVAVVEFEL